MIVLLVHSKSKALLSASRTRGSANFRRLVLMNQPCAPDGVSSGISSRTTRPSFTAGKKNPRPPKREGENFRKQKERGGGDAETTRPARGNSKHPPDKIICPPTHAPPARTPPPPIFDIAARFETADFVRSRAKRNFQGRLVERPRRVISAGKDRQAADEERHVARALGRKAHGDTRVIVGLGAKEIAQKLAD